MPNHAKQVSGVSLNQTPPGGRQCTIVVAQAERPVISAILGTSSKCALALIIAQSRGWSDGATGMEREPS